MRTINILPFANSKAYLSVVDNKLTLIGGNGSNKKKAIKKIAENLFRTDDKEWKKVKGIESKKIKKLLPKQKMCISRSSKKKMDLYGIKAEKKDIKKIAAKVDAAVQSSSRKKGVTKIVGISLKETSLAEKLKNKNKKYHGYKMEKNTREMLEIILFKKA